MGSPQASSKKFDWLADLQQSQCYTTCDWANPAKSTDFGSDGFTASVTDWHELLQLTAPNNKCGMVYVKGGFPNTPDAILARAQTREDSGSKGTFDIHFLPEIPPDNKNPSSTPQTEHEKPGGYALGDKRAQGLANFRWPYMQYELERKKGKELRKGGYEGISFIKGGTMFQIIRLTAEVTPRKQDSWPDQSIQFRLGGKVQFGCPCSNGIEQSPTRDYEFDVLDEGYRLVYNSKHKHYDHRLEIQAFINGEQERITECDKTSATGRIKVTLSQTPAIVVTTYTLRDLSKMENGPDPYPMIPMVDSATIENYLGISNTSHEMTDKLWLASLTKQFDAVETLEICAVARYVEQILGVSSIPIHSVTAEHSFDVDRASSPNFESIPGIALIRNIMTSQYVELESTFWQIRFLVKAYNFLATRSFKESLLEKKEIDYMGKMRKAYLFRIQCHIQLALVWMIKAEVKTDRILLPTTPENASTGELMNKHSGGQRIVAIDSSYNQACFTRIAVWYVFKYCGEAFTPGFRSFILSRGLGAGYGSNEAEKESTPKNDVLLWFDTSCHLLLWQELHPEVNSSELQRILSAQELREKIAKRLRKKQSGPYSMEDEQTDRLFLLGEELGLQNPSGTSAVLATARAQQTRSRIANRKPTEMFSCGPRLGTIRRSPRLISNAPWELALLNHHTLLQVSLQSADEINTSQSRDACFQFFLSDYTFMVSWDRADKSMIGKWWDIEPGAVICSTLLDKIERAKSNSTLSTNPTKDLSQSQQFEQPSTTGPQAARVVEEAVKTLIAQFEAKQESYQISRGDRLFPHDFDWRRCKPNRIYHLKSWVQSLDDTPEIFYSKHASFPPQRIIKYLMNGKDPKEYEHPKYSKKDVHKKIKPHDLPLLSTFDLKLKRDFTFFNESIILQGEDRTSHHRTLLKSLNDCLVDRDTKYRILFAEKCCPEVVSAFAYVWHPDALDTFDNYFGTTSHFADTRDPHWTTTITISHWKLLKSGLAIDKSDLFYEGEIRAGRKDGEFPPIMVSSSWKILEERSSSLVITGDVNGYNWICSIWSSLTDSIAIKADIDRLPRILHLFIHKQGTGRCLIFFIILGHICGKLADEYNGILKHLDSVVELGEEALFKGLEWEPLHSIEKLKKMIWGGQALRIFDERLSASLSQIRNAKEALDHNIKQDEGQQHVELLQEYMTVLEGFEKNFSRLSNVQVRIQHKIKHVIGLRDGISTVTNVEDSRTALKDSKTNITLSKTTIKQGNNIRVLTLLTIVYLPLGYVTGLFSENHGILPNSAGKDLYAGLVVLFTVVTYGLAWRLDKVMEFLKTKGKILKLYFDEDEPDMNAVNSGSNNPEISDEATPFSSRATANGSVDVAKQRTNPGPSKRRWRWGWGSRKVQAVPDEEIPLE